MDAASESLDASGGDTLAKIESKIQATQEPPLSSTDTIDRITERILGGQDGALIALVKAKVQN